jgi:iron complex transport system substrate-binding protein
MEGDKMRRKTIVLALGLAVLLMMSALMIGCGEKPATDTDKKGAQTIKITDLSGREVEIKAPAKKIVAIGPGALRLVCYVNGADKVIGVEELEKKSPTGRPYFMANSQLKDLPTIGPGGPDSTPDAEKLVTIKPDVIFSCLFTDKAKADDLQAKTGIPVVVLDYGQLSTFSKEIYDSLNLIGKVTGEEKRAKEVVDVLDKCQKDMNDRTKGISENEKPKVYVGGVSSKGAHGIESTYGKYPPLTAVNAKNVADEAGKAGSISIDREKLISWNPDILFIDAGGFQLVKDDYKKDPKFYQSLSAVKKGEVYCLIPYNWYWTNIETALADAYYAGKVIYPDEFKDIDPVKKADEIYKFMIGKPLYEEMAKEYVGFKKITLE